MGVPLHITFVVKLGGSNGTVTSGPTLTGGGGLAQPATGNTGIHCADG